MEQGTAGETAFEGPPAVPELRVLAPLLGSWRSDAMTENSVLGPGIRVTSTETFSWLDGGYFLVQTYRTIFGADPAQTGINYWFYDARVRTFRIIFFSNNGPYTEDGNRYEGELSGNTLTFTGPARFQYDLDSTGRIRVAADGTVTVRWWLRDERGLFQPWMIEVFSTT
jgi:hypothetical protein